MPRLGILTAHCLDQQRRPNRALGRRTLRGRALDESTAEHARPPRRRIVEHAGLTRRYPLLARDQFDFITAIGRAQPRRLRHPGRSHPHENLKTLADRAIKLAVAILDGQKPADKHVLFNSPGLATDLPAGAKYAPDSTVVKMELGKNVFPDLAPGISLPISPDWVEITPKEAAGS